MDSEVERLQQIWEDHESEVAHIRPYAKWHPWAQIWLWLYDWEARHEYDSWERETAILWVLNQLKEHRAMVDEVNAKPLAEGFIYPLQETLYERFEDLDWEPVEDKVWVRYIISDLIKLGWVRKMSGKRYQTGDSPLFSAPAEWLAAQCGCWWEMRERGMEFERCVIESDWDLGYTRRWEEITGLFLFDEPQWVDF